MKAGGSEKEGRRCEDRSRVRVMRSQAKECRLSLQAGKSKGMISFLHTES